MRLFKKANPDQVRASEDQRVIIRIWMPKVDGDEVKAKKAIKKTVKDEKKGVEDRKINVGHVSIETPTQYISLWPSAQHELHDSNKAEETSVLFRLQAICKPDFHSYAEDVAAEGCDNDLTVCLYSLTASAIDAEFKRHQDSDIGWTLVVSSSQKQAVGQSCASCAYQLLKTGGIAVLTSTNPGRFAITPDSLAELAQEAKRAELKRYPETRAFVLANEGQYLPEEGAGCQIM